jgi:endogenous inhibitor of DNA gyrase (YacG/DUF329 family)
MKQGVHTPCSTCGKPSGGRWEVGQVSYCSVKCAEAAGHDVTSHHRPAQVSQAFTLQTTPTPYA